LLSTFYDVEYSTLGKAKAADLCASCWPFGKDDIAARPGQMELFTPLTDGKPWTG
jgi:hypothetical protein